MLSQLINLVSLSMVATVLFIPVFGVKRILLLQITLISLSHVYATGVALFSTMMFYYITSLTSAQNKNLTISIPRAIIFIWSTWFVFTSVSWLINGASVRGVFQGVEFVFYGILISFVYEVIQKGWVSCDKLLFSLSIASLLLAVVFVFVSIEEPSMWPAILIGKNEGAFFLTLAGLGSALYFFDKYSSWKKLLPLVLLVIILLGIFSTGSRSGAASSIILIALYLWFVLFQFSPKYILPSLMIFVLMVYLISPIDEYLINKLDTIHDFSNKERFLLLLTSYDLFLQKPFLGWGWGSVDFLMQKYSITEGSYPHPHNTYARFAIELGFIGLSLFFVLIVTILIQSIRSIKLGCNHCAVLQFVTSLAVFLFAFVDALFYGGNRGIVLSIILGICFAISDSQKSYIRLIMK